MNRPPKTNNNKINSIEKVKRSIESDILNGILYPKQRIIEEEIAAKLGMSRTPVREALKQLEVEGLVTRLPTRGLVVTAISEDDIRHTFEVREALETMAVKLVCERITDKDAAKLKRYLENYQKDVDKFLWGKSPIIDPHWSIIFHTALFLACNNPRLIHYIEELRDVERLVYVGKYFKEPELSLFHEQHNRIVQNIAKRDVAEATKAVKAHLGTMCQIYIEHL
jgi:DNA-binding GntR family transcriptional regulator